MYNKIRKLYYKGIYKTLNIPKISYDNFKNSDNKYREEFFCKCGELLSVIPISIDLEEYYKSLYNKLIIAFHSENIYDIDVDKFYKICIIITESTIESVIELNRSHSSEDHSLDAIYESFNDLYPKYILNFEELEDKNLLRINKSKGLNLPKWYKKSIRI